MMRLRPISSKQEYRDFVERFSFLVASELEQFERAEADMQAIAQNMPKLISLVNCIGYLRGQDGAFSHLDLKEHDIDLQKELYGNEEAFEARLERLIAKVKASSDILPYYKQRLETYFVESRGGA